MSDADHSPLQESSQESSESTGAFPGGFHEGFSQELGWLLDDLVTRVSAVRHAVALSDGGILAGASRGLAREDAEHLAAIAFGVRTLAERAGRRFRSGRVRQAVVEMQEDSLFIASGADTVLAVLTGNQAEPELIAYELNRLARRAAGRLHAPAQPGG